MASVTSFTADRMQEIEDNCIVDAEIIDDDLILIKNDGSVINTGKVRESTPGGIPYLARHKLTSISPANTSPFVLDYDGSDSLDGGMLYSAGVTTVPIPGKYQINAAIHLQSTATTAFTMAILKNGSVWRQLNYKHDGTNASYSINTCLSADTNDTFAIRVNVPVAGNTIYGVAPGIRYTYLDITWVGR